MKYFIFTASAILLFNSLVAQNECGNCKFKPHVAQYDLDMQVPQPVSNGEVNDARREWKELQWYGKKANELLFKKNQTCVRFIQALSVDNTLIVGQNYTNVPSPGMDMSKGIYRTDYLTTGYIKQSGDGYVMHIQVQTACSRETVASATVPFKVSLTSDNTEIIAQQAVDQLSPLNEKIKKFEVDAKQKDKKLSILQTNWEGIKISPRKSILTAGESTDLAIEAKDCDGVPLQGIEISFKESDSKDFKTHNTVGGNVMPSKVTTDANGKATARFTLKAGSKEALIKAHTIGTTVRGCKSLMTGSAAINIKRSYSGTVTYSFDQIDQCEKTWTSESKVSTEVTKWNNIFKVEYNASFYSNDPGFDGDEDMFVLETGAMINDQNHHKKMTVKNNPPTEQIIKKNQSGALKSGTVRFAFDEGGEYANLNLRFMLEGNSSFSQTYLPSANNPVNEEFVHSVQFQTLTDKNVQYKKTTSGGKVVHTITYLRTESKECLQVVERMQLTVTEN